MGAISSTVAVVATAAVVIGGGATAFRHLSYATDRAQVEQLRSDLKTASASKSVEVLGQVTEWNQTIAANKSCNKLWYCDWTASDSWDRVEPIALP